MALTPLQARDRYIINSFANFLDRNLKQAYDAEVAATAENETLDISKPLKIMQGKPSDSSVALDPPTIAIDDLNSGQAVTFLEVGNNIGWRSTVLSLYCYPAVNANSGEPSDEAATLLKSYMRDVLQSVSFKVLDFSNPDFSGANILYCNDNVYIDRFTAPMNRGKNNPNSTERNRFDISVHLRYPVSEQTFS